MEYNNLFEEFFSLTKECLPEEEIQGMKGFFNTLSESHINITRFTDLQSIVFKNPDFWKLKSIIKGTTSSGKTLIAETAMAHQLNLDKKVIYLVPLKALITEKMQIFMKDFPEKRIYSSSSDYQENDIDFTKGNYDIGILVYEKFFALLSQKNSKILNNCGIIVVDELHMISDRERGPKLEFSLEKVRSHFKKERSGKCPLICGLTTIESNVDEVFKWFGGEKDTIVISSDNRPVRIEERFIYGSELEENFEIDCYKDGEKIEDNIDFKVNPDIKQSNDRRIYQLSQILLNHMEDKIVIFCNSKKSCEETAKFICSSGYIEPVNLRFDDFPSAEECEMEEKHYSKFRSNIENFGVAYHNSSHTSIMRNYIEKNFNEKDIRIVVATETLTMGVNMPTDVMVLYDTDVNREDTQRMMTYHEYKNAIGRAGRYGKSRNNSGISYVLCKTPNDKKRAIKAYIENPEIIKITSGLQADLISEYNYALALAPYYLSILSSMEKFSETDVLNIVKNALCRPENVDIESEEKLAKDIISIFESSYKNKDGRNYPFPVFIHEPDDYDDYYYDDSEIDDAKYYSVNMFGRFMSSFALSMFTYTRICQRFINDANGNSQLIKHHIPKYTEENEFDIEPHDFEKKYDKPSYFFDVIFQVCSMPEICKKKKNQYVTIRGNDNEYKKAILRFLKGKEKFFWENSIIRKYCSDDCTIDLIHEESVQPIYRTIILYYWALGVTAPQIRKNLGFPNNSEYYIYSSEIESLGELCAFQLEAISKAFDAKGNTTMRDMFYSLSIRVKYGMGRQLAQIANKHIQGVSRTILLKMEKKGREHGFGNAVEFLHSRSPLLDGIIRREHQQKLIESLRKTNTYDYDNMLEYLKKEDVIDDEIIDLIGKCRTFGNRFGKALYILLLHMGLNANDIESNSDNLIITPYNLILYFCTKNKPDYTDEKFTNIGIYNNKDIYENDGHFIYINNLCEIILYSIHYVRSVAKKLDVRKDKAVENAGMYFARLLLDYPKYRENIFRSGTREELFSKYAQNKNSFHKELPIVEPKTTAKSGGNNITNNYYIGKVNISQNNNIQNITQNYIVNISAHLDEMKIKSDENSEDIEVQEDKYFNKAYELIEKEKKLSPDPEKIKEILDENGNKPTFEELDNYVDNVEGLETMIFEALYIENIINHHELNDYSSASVMYSRSLEHCLKMRIFPRLVKLKPDFSCKIDNTFLKLKSIDKQKVMLGQIMYIIKNLCFNSGKNLCIKDTDKQKKWKSLYDLIENAKSIRNPCSHSGTTISKQLIKDLRNAVFSVLEFTLDEELYC